MSDHTFCFDAIGTRWTVETPSPLSADVTSRLAALVEAFDATYSRFRPDSMVTAMSCRPGRYHFPDDARPLFALYRRLYDATGGALTPLVGGVLDHLGYDAGYRLRPRPGAAPAVPHWDDVMVIDETVVTIEQPLILDFGAAGKGHLVDLVADLLGDAGLDGFVVDASGDVVRRGAGWESVALEDPQDATRAIGIAHLTDGALCASSASRRHWGSGLHHIIDPTTSTPTDDILATWVTHASCAVADGLATALFLSAPAGLSEYYDFTYVRLRGDRTVDHAPGFDGELFVHHDRR